LGPLGQPACEGCQRGWRKWSQAGRHSWRAPLARPLLNRSFGGPSTMANRRDQVPSRFRTTLWRALRWAALGAALPVVWACNAHSLEAPTLTPTATTQSGFQETANRKLDILFMIDNSNSMEHSQANLAKNLPALMDILKTL